MVCHSASKRTRGSDVQQADNNLVCSSERFKRQSAWPRRMASSSVDASQFGHSPVGKSISHQLELDETLSGSLSSAFLGEQWGA